MSNPLANDLAVPYMRGRNPKTKREQEQAADLDYAQWRQALVDQLYADSREPPPPRKRHGGTSTATR